MRTQQPPRLHAVAAALICHAFITSAQLATASGGSYLNNGQLAGVVIGSVGGALLLSLITVSICCLRAFRRCQTGDLAWAKTAADVEAAVLGQIPHQPLSGPCTDDMAATVAVAASSSERRAVGATATAPSAFLTDADADATLYGHANRTTDVSTVTGQSAATCEGDLDYLASLPNLSSPHSRASPGGGGGRRAALFRVRSSGGVLGGALKHWFSSGRKVNMRRNSGGIKDKYLEVSRSARIEPSAEVELAEPFQPAATNMGPPLSKSSMLLRWLNAADEGLPDGAAAQLAAATVGDRPASQPGGKNATGRGGSGAAAAAAAVADGGGRGGLGTSLDRLPLLSLAALQKGIVWNKMPPSVASSPAVSLVESSSVHMLKGSIRRSDEPEAHVKPGSPEALVRQFPNPGAWHGGDDRYPASLGRASVDAFSDGGTPHRAVSGGGGGANRPGIVFDYVVRPSRSTAGGRTSTSGAPQSRIEPTVGAGGPVRATSNGGGGAGGGAGADTVAAAAETSLKEDTYTLGGLPDENTMAKAQECTAMASLVGATDSAAAAQRPPGGRLWLHQVPPTKLTALQEADAEMEEEEEVAQSPLPKPPQLSQPPCSSTKELLPLPPHTPAVAAPSPAKSSETSFSSPAAPPPLTTAAAVAVPLRADSAAHEPTHQARSGWMHFGDDGDVSLGPRRGGSGQRDADSIPEPPLPVSSAAVDSYASRGAAVHTRTMPPSTPQPAAATAVADEAPTAFASAAAAAAAVSAASTRWTDGTDCSANSGGTDVCGGSSGNIGVGVGVFKLQGRRPSEPTLTTAAGGAPWVSPRASASQLHRRAVVPSPLPLPLHTAQSSNSLRSQTSLVSPSLSLHYPELPDAAVLPEPRAPASAQRRGSSSINDWASSSAAATPPSGGGGD